VFSLLCVLVSAVFAVTTSDDVFHELPAGPHRVGFQTWIETDAARRYVTAFDGGETYGAGGKEPRPILVNLWYPAAPSEPDLFMPYRRYLEIEPEDPELQGFAEALIRYAADVVSNEVFEKPVAELDDVEREVWERFLDKPTRCIDEAEPHSELFPVVVYHSGAGSSYEDNTVFYEYLASHGYVVLGSAFPDAAGSGFAIDGGDGSVRDMEYLSRIASSLPFADWQKVAYAGHSLGAQVCMRALARPDCPADAVILLDTTADYYSISLPNYQYLTDVVLKHLPHYRQPILVSAGPGALFQLCDRMVHCERHYLTVPELGHNEFIAQGLQRLEMLQWMAEDQPTAQITKELRRLPAVTSTFAELCQIARTFLDAYLKNEPGTYQALARSYPATPKDRHQLALEILAPGAQAVQAFDTSSSLPPTPRQLIALAHSLRGEDFRTLLQRFHKTHRQNPMFENPMLMCSILYELVETNRLEDAQELHQVAKRLNVNGVGTFRFLAYMSQLGRNYDRARNMLQVALQIDPEDETTLKKIEELEAKEAATKKN
jgi:pimeloyl-ACP methyl ester carboxylesterase